MTNTPVLSAINIYPVKSCRGIALKTSHIDTWGLKYDRNWMVVNAEGGFLTQRKYPQMALIETELNPDALLLRVPNMPELRIQILTKPPVAEGNSLWSRWQHIGVSEIKSSSGRI
jgi:hypothetical protein